MVSPNPFQENRLGKGKKTRNQIVSPPAKRRGAHQSVFPSTASIDFLRRLQGNRNNRLVMPPIIDALANFGSYYKSVVQ